MKNIIGISKYELKLMLREKIFWIAFVVLALMSIADNIPIESNLERLPFTVVPGYTVSRLLIQMGMILTYFMTFLFSNRIYIDKKTSMISVFKIYNIDKTEYIIGKFLGGFFYFIIIFFCYLLINGVVFFIVNPSIFALKPYIIGFVLCVLPVSFFVVNVCLALPLWFGKKVTYVIITLYFVINIMTVPNSNSLPPYFLFYGELIKNVYRYGLEGVDRIAMLQNALFLFGGGIVALFLVIFNRKVWELYEEI